MFFCFTTQKSQSLRAQAASKDIRQRPNALEPGFPRNLHLLITGVKKNLQEGLEKPPGLEFRKSFEHSFETLRFWSWMRYFLHLFLKATFAGHHVYSVCTYTGVPIV